MSAEIRTSMNGRNSYRRYQMTKNMAFQMSEQSPSIVNDLLMIETQLRMVDKSRYGGHSLSVSPSPFSPQFNVFLSFAYCLLGVAQSPKMP